MSGNMRNFRQPNERKIKRYQETLRNFNAKAYRKAWHKTGEQLKRK